MKKIMKKRKVARLQKENNLVVYIHQFFFPTQTRSKLEKIVADA